MWRLKPPLLVIRLRCGLSYPQMKLFQSPFVAIQNACNGGFNLRWLIRVSFLKFDSAVTVNRTEPNRGFYVKIEPTLNRDFDHANYDG
jgi:hypothetical protein